MEYSKEIAIYEAIEKITEQEYRTGENDCYINALRIVDIINETKYFEKVNGKYRTFKTGLKNAIKMTGHSNLDELLKDNGYEIEKNLATVGDIVLIDIKENYFATLIHLGDHLFQSGDPKQKASLIPLDSLEDKEYKIYRVGGVQCHQ